MITVFAAIGMLACGLGVICLLIWLFSVLTDIRDFGRLEKQLETLRRENEDMKARLEAPPYR